MGKRGGKRPGAGRKPSRDPTIAIMARIRRSVFDRLHKYATSKGLSISAAVAEAVDGHLKKTPYF